MLDLTRAARTRIDLRRALQVPSIHCDEGILQLPLSNVIATTTMFALMDVSPTDRIQLPRRIPPASLSAYIRILGFGLFLVQLRCIILECSTPQTNRCLGECRCCKTQRSR
jgi:hypothetical protein